MGGTFRLPNSSQETPIIMIPNSFLSRIKIRNKIFDYDSLRMDFFDPDTVIGELYRAGRKTGKII